MTESECMKEPSLNPVVSAAACLHKLRSPAEKPATQKELEKELGIHMVNVTMGHLKELEGMLVVQANVLQALFTHAAERYAAAGDDDGKAKLYSAIALKAQNHSRQTVALVARIKKSSDYNRRPPINVEKMRNELFRPAPVRHGPEADNYHAPEVRELAPAEQPRKMDQNPAAMRRMTPLKAHLLKRHSRKFAWAKMMGLYGQPRDDGGPVIAAGHEQRP